MEKNWTPPLFFENFGKRGGATLITQQTICCLMVSITGLARDYSNNVAYQDVKKPQYIIAKNAMSVFTLTVLD